jgi:hypothetical protein
MTFPHDKIKSCLPPFLKINFINQILNWFLFNFDYQIKVLKNKNKFKTNNYLLDKTDKFGVNLIGYEIDFNFKFLRKSTLHFILRNFSPSSLKNI